MQGRSPIFSMNSPRLLRKKFIFSCNFPVSLLCRCHIFRTDTSPLSVVVFSFSGPHDVHPARLYRSVANGRWFCNTLERVGYQIPPLCYHVAVTMSPKFRRLLPIVQNVPGRLGIRFHVGKVPKHSTGCILLPDRETENHFTNLLLDIQAHEEIILEVTDFRPGTELGYNTPCPSSECAREKEIRSANFARRHSYLAGARTIVSSSILEPTRLSDGY